MSAAKGESVFGDNTGFNEAVRQLSELFIKYSCLDILTSITATSLWLPNISSQIKHQLLFGIFLNIEESGFSEDNSIHSYEDFKKLIGELSALLPDFLFLEDYVPEKDWGEIKFYHNKKVSKILYGSDISNVYDYLTLFQILHGTQDKEYLGKIDRSPEAELSHLLAILDQLISGINTQPAPEQLEDISPGFFEAPSEDFWKNTADWFKEFRPEDVVPIDFIKRYSVALGDIPDSSLLADNFSDSVCEGGFIPSFFIEYCGRYYPFLPRRYPAIFYDSWLEVFEALRRSTDYNPQEHRRRISGGVFRYLNGRISTKNKFPFVSASHKDGKFDEFFYPAVFISQDRLVLLYIMSPSLSGDETSKELAEVFPKLVESVKLLSKSPTILARHLDREHIKLESRKEGRALEPEPIILIPQATTQFSMVEVPVGFEWRIWSLDQFLGVIDEIDTVDSFSEFLDYLNQVEDKIPAVFSLIDQFASFKESYGVLIDGALEPSMIMLNPHWGSNFRFESLKDFWCLFPQSGYFDHPRCWRIIQEGKRRIRLDARGYFGSALFTKVNSTNVFVTAPFNEMTYEQAKISNLIMECLEDNISRLQLVFKDHQFFKTYPELNVLLFPQSLIKDDEKFSHIRHLINKDKWQADIGLIRPDVPGIRLAFEDVRMIEKFEGAQDATLEIELLCEVLHQINELCPDNRFNSIIDEINRFRSEKPGFRIFKEDKLASFPEFANACEPLPVDFKKARKCVAESAYELKICEGDYELEEAKKIIDSLKGAIIQKINGLVETFNLKGSIPFLIGRVDALVNAFEQEHMKLKRSFEHRIEFNPNEQYARTHSKYIRNHKNYRYLIEKFVQISPEGEKVIDPESFRFLIALIDWLHVFYEASDVLHYGIMPACLKLGHGYLPEVIYESDSESKQQALSEELAKVHLQSIGSEDTVTSPRPVENFLNELEKAFVTDLGFNFRRMNVLLHVLAFWPSFCAEDAESEYYTADYPCIEKVCMDSVGELEKDEFKLILDFLILKQDEVLRIRGQDQICEDLPVWEHNKRFARYTIRPIIRIDNTYYWGPHSARKALDSWSFPPMSGRLTVDLEGPTITAFLESEKKLIEDALTDKAYEIVKRFTSHASKNCELHKVDKSAEHPQELGDYDVLAFMPDKAVLLNVECKDVLGAYCLKDSRRFRDKIFGRPGKNDGHVFKIQRRASYLGSNLKSIANALKWPIDSNSNIKVISLHVSRHIHWWSQDQPYQTDIQFIAIHQLSDFIASLGKV